jgi:hypothetical protein
VVEGYTGNPETFNQDGLLNNPRYVHQVQHGILIQQGLDRDPVRGAVTSSSMREAPSTVFGISTPGRTATPGTEQVSGNQTGVDTADAVVARVGGHSFVMDDGATGADNIPDGTDNMIRLRSAGGHQILMNDTEDILYIASASGNQWLEFSNDGSVNVYAAAGLNIRTQGVLNLQSDGGILMDSPVIEMHAEKGISISSDGTVAVTAEISASIIGTGMATLSAGGICSVGSGGVTNVGSAGITNISGSLTNLTGAPGVGASIAIPTKTVTLPDVKLNGQLWTFNTNSLTTVCSRAPSHEPWIDPTTNERPVSQFPPSGSLLGGIATSVIVNMAASAGSGAAAMGFNSWKNG